MFNLIKYARKWNVYVKLFGNKILLLSVQCCLGNSLVVNSNPLVIPIGVCESKIDSSQLSVTSTLLNAWKAVGKPKLVTLLLRFRCLLNNK